MAKKLVLATLIALTVAFYAIAQDAAAPAAPKFGYALTQKVETDTYNGYIDPALVYTNSGNSQYSQTNFKAQVELDLGGGVKLTPWIQDRFEVKIDPTFLSTTGWKAASTQIDNFRNRFYAGLNSSFAFDKAFNLGVNLEYRNGSNIKSYAGSAGSANNLPESRFTPYLVLSGKIENLYYNLTTDLPIYFDLNGSNNVDDSAYELEGTYNLGYGIPLDEKNTLKIDLNYYFDYYNIAGNITSQQAPLFASEMREKIILVSGDFAPFIGFLMSYTWKSDKNVNGAADLIRSSNIMGGTVGADIKLGANASFNVTADVGVDTYSAIAPLVTAVTASISIKG